MRVPFTPHGSRTMALLLAAALAWPVFPRTQSPVATPAQELPQPDARASKLALDAARNAQAQGQLEYALAGYDQAARLDPSSKEALQGGAAIRSRLVHQHVYTAERLALLGDFDHAAAELRAALLVDPGNSSLRERLQEISSMGSSTATSESKLAGVPRLQPLPQKHSFSAQSDLQTVYQELARAYGLKVMFDPDLSSRLVKFHVDDLDFPTALSILELQTATFIRPMDAHTFFVAQDTVEKRREFQTVVEQMFTLPDSVTPEEMTEEVHVIRTITGTARADLDQRSRTITIRDTPEAVALTGEILRQFEQVRGELMLDIEILEVDRNKAQQLGITPPSGAQIITFTPAQINQLEQATTVQELYGILGPILTAKGGNAATLLSSLANGQPPPVVTIGGGNSTVLLALPGAVATFSQAFSLVRGGQRVLLRAQDGKPATFFVGERYPISLAQFSASVGLPSPIPTTGAAVPPRLDVAVGAAPVALAAADFNADGAQDLAVVNHNDNSISILLNQGGNTGNLAQATGSPILLGPNETGPSAIVAASFNNLIDSILDLLIVNQTSSNVALFAGKGDGTFTEAPGSPIATGLNPSAAVAGDFNNDGNTDFAVANFTDNSISVFLGDGRGGFTPASGSPFLLPTGEQGPVAMAAADFDGDGRVDLAIVNRTTNNVSILRGQGDGTFTPMAQSPIAVGAAPVAIAARDLNADSHVDLAVVNQADNTVTVLLNNGDGTFTVTAESPLATGATPTGIAITDVNADSIADLVVSSQGANNVGVFVGLGGGLFNARFELPAVSGGGPSALAIADMNGDNRPDAIVTEENTNQVSVIFNPSNASPTGGIASQPYPYSEYVDLGFKVKATPVLHPNNEVTLLLEFEVRSLSGSAVNNIPVLTNRTITQSVRVKENQTTILGGMLDTEGTEALSGLPGLAPLPGAGYLFGTQSPQSSNTEMLIMVTPRQIRRPMRTAKTLYAGRGGSGAAEQAGGGPPARGGQLPREAQPPPEPAPQQTPAPAAPVPLQN